MNPLRQDDPRHVKALAATRLKRKLDTSTLVSTAEIVDAYFTALNEQGVVLVEAYAGDDAGRT